MNPLKIWSQVFVSAILLFTFSLTAQESEKDVIIFWNGTKVVGYLEPAEHADFVRIRTETGSVLTYNWKDVRRIIKESELDMIDVGPVLPEINLYLQSGYGFMPHYGPSAGVRGGVLLPESIFIGMHVQVDKGPSRNGLIRMVSPTTFVRDDIPLRESFYGITLSAQAELVRRYGNFRTRVSIGAGAVFMQSRFDYSEMQNNPDYIDFEPGIDKITERHAVFPLAASLEYSNWVRMLLGFEARYSYILKSEVEPVFPKAVYDPYVYNMSHNLSIHLNMGYRIFLR